MNNTRRALLASAVGAALILAPASALAAGGASPKPPKGAPACTLSAGVSMTAVKSKGVVTGWVITGTTGSDTIDCSASTSTMGVTINARGGALDTVYGTPQADVINAGSSANGQLAVLFGMAGNDTIHGGWGIQGNSAQANVEGGAGNDTIIADGGTLYTLAGDGDDSIDARSAWSANSQGQAGNDTILGPTSADCNLANDRANGLFGGTGNDLLTGGDGRDHLFGGPGTDVMHAGAGDDLLQDEGSGAETFDCGDGIDGVNDYDGNGSGDNGTGFANQNEDDTWIACESQTVATTCNFTIDETGCIFLTGLQVTDDPSTAVYTISGSVRFTPTCQNLVGDCSYANVTVSGSGTFSVSGSATASGTWTIPLEPNDQPAAAPYNFLDASGNNTTCNSAVIRTVTFNIPLVASDSSTGGGYLTVRTDNVGTTSRAYGYFSGGLPGGFEWSAFNSQAGFAINC